PLGARSLLPGIHLKAVAVWDTVGAMGIPLYAGNHRYDLFRFVDKELHESVEFGFHAMAVDELRADFEVTRWNARPSGREVWFVGAHADVGGGYPQAQSRMSDAALSWMIANLQSVGVTFSAPLTVKLDAQSLDQDIHRPWQQPPFVGLPQGSRSVSLQDTLHA